MCTRGGASFTAADAEAVLSAVSERDARALGLRPR